MPDRWSGLEGARVDMHDFASRIEAAKDDSSELSRIVNELAQLPGDEARRLRFRANGIRLRLAMRKVEAKRAAVAAPAWLCALGIAAIDGRPLYRYNLSDGAFQELESCLTGKAASFYRSPDIVSAAQFVLWAAEWFRRKYDGSGLKWESLGGPLGVFPDWATYKILTDRGLRYWQIPPLHINGTHHRIAAIARQGGFPIAAVEAKGSRWAPQFLERLVGQLLAEPTPTLDAADRIADSLMSDFVPQTWRNQEIRVVSAELAMEIVRLRMLAESHGVPAGGLVSAWLDRNVPNWRDDLPIGVSSEAGRALVDGLMKAVVLKGGAGSVEVKRLLVLEDGGRRERIELKLAGILRDATGRAIAPALADEWMRLRIYPSGQFAHFVSGELASADPSDGVWLSRPSSNRSQFDLPCSIGVTAELRGSGQRVGSPFILPGGEAIVSNVRVYVADESDDDVQPTKFLQIGTGSGGYRATRLHVDLPTEWSCTAHNSESQITKYDVGAADQRVLWTIEGAALIKSPHGDTYLIRSGQRGDARDHLFMIGELAPGCLSADSSAAIFLGPPTLRVREGFRERAASGDEVYWRPRETAAWLSRPVEASPGYVQFAWRDAGTGHIRDRQDAIVLPPDFSIERRRHGDWLDLKIVGWHGAIEVDGATTVGDVYRLRLSGTTHSSCKVHLHGHGPQPLCLVVPLPHDAWVETWNDGPVARTGIISLSGINRFVARVDGRCELMADLLDRDRRPLAEGFASWWIDDELPLSAISDDIATLLRPHGDIRASVKLNFNDSHENYWFVGEFDYQLVREGRGWLPNRALVDEDSRMVGRALHEPAKEHDFGALDLAACLNHRPFELPTLRGCWLIYLRSNERVLSCPQFINGLELGIVPNSPLSKAMAIRELEGRNSALDQLVEELFADPTTADSRTLLRAIIDLAVSLDGLPPATFDVLSLISRKPLLGAILLFCAADLELEPVLRIADGLPFDWSLMPQGHWEQAAKAQFAYLSVELPGEIETIAQMIGDRRKALADLVPALASLLGQRVERQSIALAANSFLNRSSDLIHEGHSPFRPQHADKLPEWTVRPEYWRALDAPMAAALSAIGATELNSAQIRCITQVHRRHPRWFREGYVAALLEFKSWQT